MVHVSLYIHNFLVEKVIVMFIAYQNLWLKLIADQGLLQQVFCCQAQKGQKMRVARM
jgi:hypothetical protein